MRTINVWYLNKRYSFLRAYCEVVRAKSNDNFGLKKKKMQFVYPTFLFALAALAIPIILHLFYFRRFKKVYFTNVRFLKEVKEETSARSKLRNILVLLSRLLALAFLVLAFAQPFIPQRNAEVKKGAKSVSVFIDNSFSMSGESQDVALIEKAKQRAREVVEAYNVADQFQVLTNDFEGRHQRLVSKEDALSLIDEIEISPEVKQLSSVLARQQQVLKGGESDNLASYLISDFQKNITDLENHKDTTIDVSLIPLQSVQERNISIDSAWFESPVQMFQQANALIVKVTNRGETDANNVRLAILHEDQTKPVGTLDIPAYGSVLDTVNITILRTGWHQAELSISDYPIQFDDKYFITFNVAELINILAINNGIPNPYLTAIFGGIGYVKLDQQNANNLDYSQFKNYQLVITDDLETLSSGLAFELQQFANSGGNLMVFPSRNANMEVYQDFLSNFPANEIEVFEEQRREVGYINTEEFVFNDVFENKDENLKLPVTQANFRLSKYDNRKEERLLSYRDGNTFLGKYQINQGHLYLCAAPLDVQFNNLVNNAEIFVPLIYKAAISSGKRRRIAYTIGKDEVIEINQQVGSADKPYKFKGQDKEFIPEQRQVNSKAIIGLGNQIQLAGYYDLSRTEDEIHSKYAFNFDRQESDLRYYTVNELRSIANQKFNVIGLDTNAVLTATIEERSQGFVLWRWCIIFMLVFLAIEVLLLRFWKV